MSTQLTTSTLILGESIRQGGEGKSGVGDHPGDLESGALPDDADLMEGIERIRVGSKLRDLHGLFEQELLFEATRDV